jgi:hypothetical protein
MACHQRAQIVKLKRVIDRKLAHIDAFIGHSRNQAFAFERAGRLAHGGAADTKLFGQGVFIESLTGGDIAVQDHPLQFIAHLKNQRALALEHGGVADVLIDLHAPNSSCGGRIVNNILLIAGQSPATPISRIGWA